MDNDNSNNNSQSEKKPTVRTPKSSKLLVEARVAELRELLLSGRYKADIEKEKKKEWNLTYKGFYLLWHKALDSVKESFKEPIEQLRSEYVNGLNSDLMTAFNNFRKYDAEDSVKAKYLALNWFTIYLKIKAEITEYYPGIKPDKMSEDDKPRLILMADDGSDDDKFVSDTEEYKETNE
jgi:hypothetical protein